VFTGIVEERGAVVSLSTTGDSALLRISGPLVTSDARPGDSIAVNGVCLTVVDVAGGEFSADVMRETLSRSSLGGLSAGSEVNLERAARVDSRIGGHIVQGHVDGTAVIAAIEPAEHWTHVRFDVPATLVRYIVEKGSITVDGVSLTVASVDDTTFSVSLIPTTLSATTLGRRAVGDTVNIEVDVLAKYVERLLEGRLA
jgi:riboflavin synthase